MDQLSRISLDLTSHRPPSPGHESEGINTNLAKKDVRYRRSTRSKETGSIKRT